MNNGIKNISKMVLLFVTLSISSLVQAVPVNGEISISGGFVPFTVVPGIEGVEERVFTGLADATGIDFLDSTGRTGVGGQFRVASAAGDFAAAGIGYDQVGSINDFIFIPFAAVEPLWSIGDFSFNLLTITIFEQTSTTLILKGSGDVLGTGFDNSAGNWILTANSFGSTFSWSSSTVTSNVPEPATLLLLGFGLLGVGAASRRKKFVA